MSIDDRALLRRIASGDIAAMEDYYRAFQSSVYRFACAQLDDGFEAAEVLDEVMLGVWRNAARLAATDDPLAAVLAMTHEIVLKLTPSPREVASGKVEEAGATGRARLYQRMAAMPAAVRAAIHLVLSEDWSSARVARAMRCEESVVHQRLREATAWIREDYSEAVR